MAEEYGKWEDTVHLQYGVPRKTWLRLRLYAKRNDLRMGKACERALERGLTDFGVPKDPGLLLWNGEDDRG